MAFDLPGSPRAILFDVGDTILEERRFDLEAGIRAVVAEDRVVSKLAKAYRAESAESHRQGSELLLAQWLHDRALASASVGSIEDAIWNAVVTLVPKPGVREIFERLCNDGIPIAAVSNGAFSRRVLRSELARFGLADQLRFVLSSADMGSRKPALAIFATAVERLGADARDTWFVGDTMDEDIHGALAAGLQPIFFSNDGGVESWSNIPVVRSWADFSTLYSAVRIREVGD